MKLCHIQGPVFLYQRDKDALRLNFKTTGIAENTFSSFKCRTYAVYDVGGVRGQRKAWVHYFENTSTSYS
ncbi:hypothetical protein F4779DRAFT_531339 [Xylariaceae sp. FL0662B]|nr:hypothetical protein F4779DRAFT_531339 [Xylariaceae sp. FL0662B]